MKPDVSSARCLRVGNPQPLSEMHNAPHVQTMERMQGVPIPAEAFTSRMSIGHDAQTVLAGAGGKHIGQGRPVPSSSSVRVEDNQHYRMAQAYDKRHESLHEKHSLPLRSDQPIHPSVIQRPQGYIPPRIVRRSISNDNNNNTEQSRMNEPATTMRHVLFHDGITERHLNQEHNIQNDIASHITSRQPQVSHRDMLSGRDVLKIQQRAAEQRNNETSVHKQQFAKQNTNGYFDNRQNTERRRSIPDRVYEVTQMEQNIMSNSSHSTKRSTLLTKPAQVAGRSITKGTSGIQKDITDPDSFSQFLMRELKKPDDDQTVNPFANRSLLQEFDRSANSSPTPVTEIKSDTESLVILPSSSQCDTKVTETSYTLPLQIAIPGHKGITTAATAVTETISKASSKQETAPSKRFMSRKQMILSAFRQEEDQKHTVESEKVEHNKNSRDVFVKPEKESSHHICPPSPKMPILSPQEKIRNSTGGSHASAAVVEPPNLENLSNPENDRGKIKKSLEEHLHQMISNALNNEPCENESKKASVDAMFRDLMSQSQSHKLFLSRQNSQTRNIPVANVAPIVHGKFLSDSSTDTLKPKTETKQESDFDEDDEKMAEAVTLSLFGNVIKKIEKDENNTQTVSETVQVKRQGSKEKTDIKEELSFESGEHLETENTKGIRSLMDDRLKRQSSTTLKYEMDTDASENNFASVLENDNKMKGRNVFGAFSDMFSEKRFYDFNEHLVVQRGSGATADKRRNYLDSDIDTEEMVRKDLTIGYDGDDETGRDFMPRFIGKQSNAKAQADRLIKRARRRHASNGGDGSMRSRPGIHRAGFKDFTPQVLPRRTRSRSLQSQTRLGSRYEGQGRRRHSSAYSNACSFKRSSTKLRRRRTSSLDREIKSKSKSRTEHGFYSDNECDLDEIRNASTAATGPVINNDESTDDEYFNTEFNNFLPTKISDKSSGSLHIAKKRKNFFKQKYIFQRKRKQGRGKHPLREQTNTQDVSGDHLKGVYSFQEENTELGPLLSSSMEYDIPVPADLKRVIVNKESGETALHKAARLGFEEVVLYLLATQSVDVNARDNAGFTPLHECVWRGHVRIGKLLLTYGANVNVCSTDGIRPIHDAVETDHIEMLRMLISFGADPSLSTYAGRSLLKIAKSDRMRNYIQDYFSDLNGYENQCHPWQFRASNTYLEPETFSGCPLFENVPSDPEDESNDMLTMTSKTLFPVRRLSLTTNKRVEDYMMLTEVYDFYNLNEPERRCMEDSYKHQIKKVPKASLMDAHADSVFLELFLDHYGDEPLPAIRMVDAGPIISKIEKLAASIKVHT
ncbi:hypothetical protein DPMN_138003 [Dreissena polymorpha]|uniref:BCL-6 corepressor n=2 Tax=Dreissena polymorpha TaxID=45954 RepID=A0A9D4JI66_DREPO|nr:hypothetical protein DPMN_138003 [Dreissena polymorpha]